LESATKDLDTFTDWVKPIRRWKKYDDYALIASLEISHLIIQGADDVAFSAPNLQVPALTIASPLGKGLITTNPFSGTISNGQAIYIKDVEFPITGSTVKNLTVGNLAQKKERRTDRIFLGMRNGDAVYFRGQTEQPSPAVGQYGIEFFPISRGADTTSGNPTALAVFNRNDASIHIRNFSASINNNLRFAWEVPTNLDDTEIVEFRVLGLFSTNGMTTQSMSFKMKGYCVGDNEDVDGTYGTEAEVVISGAYSYGDRFASAWQTVDIPGLATDKLAMLNFRRDPSDGDDTYLTQIGIYGVQIRYTKVAA
jgi:hypothetical protein